MLIKNPRRIHATSESTLQGHNSFLEPGLKFTEYLRYVHETKFPSQKINYPLCSQFPRPLLVIYYDYPDYQLKVHILRFVVYNTTTKSTYPSSSVLPRLSSIRVTGWHLREGRFEYKNVLMNLIFCYKKGHEGLVCSDGKNITKTSRR